MGEGRCLYRAALIPHLILAGDSFPFRAVRSSAFPARWQPRQYLVCPAITACSSELAGVLFGYRPVGWPIGGGGPPSYAGRLCSRCSAIRAFVPRTSREELMLEIGRLSFQRREERAKTRSKPFAKRGAMGLRAGRRTLWARGIGT